jgi:para-aminobenzoate synthetase/4-amino-4-deoxychorismate lyase
MQPWVLLEDTTGGTESQYGFLFEHPIAELCCTDATQLSDYLVSVDTWRRKGYYLVGFISYEAGYVLQGLPLPAPTEPPFPLLYFLVCSQRQQMRVPAPDRGDYSVSQLQLNLNQARYTELFAQVQAAIRDGESYQINLTAKYQFAFSGSAWGLYHALRARQRVAYSAYLHCSEYQILSHSPELFFSKHGEQLCAKPMKGTAKRGADVMIDERYKQHLRQDPKSIAENIMIVDLLRNDLARCSRPGTLATPSLLAVETYQTLHQLVSTVTSQVAHDLPFKTVIEALFPCGSITGAPKRRTMQLIHQLEAAPRAIYTGAIGYITPENDMCFSVAIRTVLLRAGRGELGVGGGIVADSTASDEFAEMQLKARYFTQCVEA